MPKPFGYRLFWLVIGIFALAGCGESTPSKIETKPNQKGGRLPRIVTTVGMVTDIVREVVGDRGEVIGLLSEGVDPHLYKPTREDVAQLVGADVIFYGGLMLEGRMEESFKKQRESGKVVVGVAESLDKQELRKPPEFEGHFDPHVWMDVTLWSQCVEAVTKTMREFDSEHADEFTARADAYKKRLQKLDEYVRQSIATIPEQQRVLVTAHDAFGYFARAYGMQVKSVQGISTESEAGVADVNALVDFLVEQKIAAIFVESSVSEKNLQAVREGAEKRGWTVKVGGELFSDAMGAAGTYEGTYIGMIDHNATTITRALGGQVPEGGFRATVEKP
ncbi:MAG: zinc ABC transporter substrate-binding protein [Planctomycetaceae bacterium]|nr:zinc ABC transporter substrate-binding protein [Planctomycetaceae bacterium]